MVKNVLSLLLGLCAVTHSFGQGHPTIDSLLQVLDTVQARQKPYVQQQLAFAYEVTVPLDTTRAYCLHVLKTLDVNQYPTVGIEFYSLTAYTYMQQGWFDSAMHYHRLEYKLAQAHDLEREKGLGLSRIGVLFKKLEVYDSSIAYFERALAIITPIGEPVSLFKVNVQRGMLALVMNDYVASQKYYLEALMAAKAIGADRFLAEAYQRLTEISFRLNLPDEHLTYAKLFYKLANNTKEMPAWALAHEELGEAYFIQGWSLPYK